MAASLRLIGATVLAGIAGIAAGCGAKETVQTYKTPRDAERGEQPRTEGSYRILGALYPAEQPIWYFKFAGTNEQVGKYAEDFNKLAESVKLPMEPDAIPEFVLPSGWKKTGPRTRNGFNTEEVLKFGPPENPLEVTITHIAGGGLEANLSRWAIQVGAAYDPLDTEAVAKAFTADKCKGLKVDLRGPKNPAARGPMIIKPH